MNDQILAVQRMQDYMAEHCAEPVTMSDLARAAGYSPWYARRLFLAWTKHTPADYLRRLRLSLSAIRLRDGRCRVSDVAMELGFGSVDGYQRAFFREFGCNPREYARHPVPLALFKPYGVRYKPSGKELKPLENLRNVFILLTEKPERKVILKRGKLARDYMSYCEETGSDIWGLLCSIPSPAGEPVCMWLPEKYRKPITNEYVQGVEVSPDYGGPVPEGFEVITLPAASYLRFQGEPFAEDDFEDAIRELWEAERRFDPASIGYRWDTENPRIQLEPIGSRGYIELCPVCR